jgi:anthranilate synthase component 2
MFLLIDNFDSFTFNLVQAFQQLGRDPVVLRNNEPRILELAQSGELSMVCISPGPGGPAGAGLCLKFLEKLPKQTPVLGVCLGHQVLGHFAGAPVSVGERIMHGKTSVIRHDGRGLFAGLPEELEVGRYHSLLVKMNQAAPEAEKLLKITAWTDEDEVMGLAYTDRPWAGVQFHPESVLSPEGPELLARFPDGLK